MAERPPPQRGSIPRAVLRTLVRLAAIALFAWLVHLLTGWVMMKTEVLQSSAQVRIGIVVAMLAVYALLLAVPFVPGVELGIALMISQGAAVAPMVYGATVVGLMLGYMAGACLPQAVLRRTLADLHMHRACALVDRIAPLGRQDRLALAQEHLPGWLAALTVRHRYLTLAALINLPGNSVLGGGGGILLVAGMSRLFSARAVALTVALAVAPVPILVWVFDLALPV